MQPILRRTENRFDDPRENAKKKREVILKNPTLFELCCKNYQREDLVGSTALLRPGRRHAIHACVGYRLTEMLAKMAAQ